VRGNGPPFAGQNGHGAAPHPAPGSAWASNEAVDFDGAVNSDAQNSQQPTPEEDPFQRLLGQFRELREYFSYYLSARADSARLGLRNALLSMTLAALAFVLVAGLSVAATWFVLSGAAEGVGVLLGNRPWAGSLATGLLLMVGLAGGMYGTVTRLKKTTREGTVAKYENRQSRQQLRYGHNVADRAAANGPDAKGPDANGPEEK
jgi:hypothetical protein